MNLANKKNGREAGISFFRFQIEDDENLSFLARKLSMMKKINYTFVSKNSITTVVPLEKQEAVPIYSKDNLQKFCGNLDNKLSYLSISIVLYKDNI